MDNLTHLLRNLYASQEATVKTRHGTTEYFKIGKGVWQGCISLPCLFNSYAEYIMWNAGLDESQAGIEIVKRNINNFRYGVDNTLKAESEEELKSFLMRMKGENEKATLKLSIQTKIMVSSLITSGKLRGNRGRSDRFYFPGLQNYCGCCLETWN